MSRPDVYVKHVYAIVFCADPEVRVLVFQRPAQSSWRMDRYILREWKVNRDAFFVYPEKRANTANTVYWRPPLPVKNHGDWLYPGGSSAAFMVPSEELPLSELMAYSNPSTKVGVYGNANATSEDDFNAVERMLGPSCRSVLMLCDNDASQQSWIKHQALKELSEETGLSFDEEDDAEIFSKIFSEDSSYYGVTFCKVSSSKLLELQQRASDTFASCAAYAADLESKRTINEAKAMTARTPPPLPDQELCTCSIVSARDAVALLNDNKGLSGWFIAPTQFLIERYNE